MFPDFYLIHFTMFYAYAFLAWNNIFFQAHYVIGFNFVKFYTGIQQYLIQRDS